MTKLTPKEIGAEILKNFPYFADPSKESKIPGANNAEPKSGVARAPGKFTGDWTEKGEGVMGYEGSSRFNDFCQIGALLTDEQRCALHLSELENLLNKNLQVLAGKEFEKALEKIGQIQRIEVQREGTEPDTPTPDTRKALEKIAKWAELQQFKFCGLLDQVLYENELRWDFHKIDGRVTLDGFVHPNTFSSELLQKMRHWKDPGADPIHGEYSHRLQWFLVCREHETGGMYRLRKSPANRFAATAAYASKHPNREVYEGAGVAFTLVTMWDFLCDCVRSESPQKDTNFISDTFRSPEYLNLYLTDPARGARTKFPILSAYLTQRFNKRNWQKVNNTLAGYLREKYKGLNFDQLPGEKDAWGLSGGKVVPRPLRSTGGPQGKEIQ